MRRFHPALLALPLAWALAALLAGRAAADPKDVAVGSVRAVLAKDGTRLMPQPVTLGPAPLQVLPYGARVTVLEVRIPWMRVRTMSGETAEGWLLAAQTVAPYGLSGEGRLGRTGPTNELARVRDLRSDEQAAVSRGLGPEQEDALRQQRVGHAAAFALLDALEATQPSPQEIEDFVREGGLGRPAVSGARATR